MNNKVMYLVAPGRFEAKNIRMPEDPEPRFVRLKHHFCGICGGDYSAFLGRRKQFPVSLGHESVSTVEAVGTGVERFIIGDIVVTDLNYRCGECDYCRSGKSHLCDKNDVGLFSNRAFALYSDVHESYLTKVCLPDDRILTGTLIEPLSCVIHALEPMVVKPDTSVLIIGCGSLGTLAAFYLKIIRNISNVFLLDIINSKTLLIEDILGAQPYLGETVDLIFEASNSVKGLLKAVDISKKGQRLCSISHLYGTDTRLIYDNLVKKEISVAFPLRNGEKHNMVKAYQYIGQNWEPEYDQFIEVIPLDKMQMFFEGKDGRPKNKSVILIND